MSTIYSVTQIVGKTLIANSPIGMKRAAADSASIAYTVNRNQPVGVVYSYLMPNSNRKNVYWMFEINGVYYYTEHKTGLFSLQGLNSQGALTIEEEVEQKKEEGTDWLDKLKGIFNPDILKYGLIGLGVWGGVTLLKSFKEEKQ